MSCAGESETVDDLPSGININNPPIADAGLNQNITTESQVMLNGSNSRDANGDLLSYSWSFSSKPATSQSAIVNSTLVNTSFTADVDGSYVVSLIVNDGKVNSAVDNVLIISSSINSMPVANAGVDQNVSMGSLVNLDGSNSSDANGDVLTYSWSLDSIPAGSNAALNNNVLPNPNFTADLEGAYRLTLIVNDGQLNSIADIINIISTTANTPPVANAGNNQSVTTGNTVNLNGSNSSDANGDILSYNWMMVSRPGGSNAALDNNVIVNPSFTADLDGSYSLSLVVNDGTVNSVADNVLISSTTANSAPVANAGVNQNVITGATVNLSGSNSSDADGDPLTYSWSFTSMPGGSGATLNNSSIVNPSFTADINGSYILSLTVNDGQVNSTADNMTVSSTTTNSAPVANAGTDQNVTTGNLVTLNGSNSSDANGDALTYNWSLVSTPGSSTATLNDNTLVSPSFTADLDGSYTLSLTVNDGQINSAADNVLISSGAQSSRLDDFSGSGPLLGYTTNNANDLPDVVRANNRYRANLIDNTGDITLHYHNDQGRLDAKEVTFPFEVIARNIGIGTQADSQIAPSSSGNPVIFAGIQVHITNLNSRNSSHIVIGHRSTTGFTVEGKNTVGDINSGSSAVTDEGQNAAPLGRADIRILGSAGGQLMVYWQQPNLSGGADNWSLYGGNGLLPGQAPTYGTKVFVGLITYAQGTVGVPFVGTCDSFEIID
jgi:K319L-like, PKD domain